jgi:hypothetical protein
MVLKTKAGFPWWAAWTKAQGETRTKAPLLLPRRRDRGVYDQFTDNLVSEGEI